MRPLPLLALLGAACGQPPAPPEPPAPQDAVPAPEWRPFGPAEIGAELLARLDEDRDGRISPQEHALRAESEPAFAALDLDGSGALDAAELLAAIDGNPPFCHTRDDPSQGGAPPGSAPPQP